MSVFDETQPKDFRTLPQILRAVQQAVEMAGSVADKGAIYATLSLGVVVIGADEVCQIAAGTADGFVWSFADYVTSMIAGGFFLVAGGLFAMYRWTVEQRTTQRLAEVAFEELHASTERATDAVKKNF